MGDYSVLQFGGITLKIELLIILTTLWCETFGTQCSRCELIEECEEAEEYYTNVTEEKLDILKRYSGCKEESGGQEYVCCSALEERKKPEKSGKIRSRLGTARHSLTEHPNFNLLPSPCEVIDNYNIAGGRNAEWNEFPWMANLFFDMDNDKLSFTCAGTLINPLYVLTAAHCIKGNKNGLLVQVRIGDYDVDVEPDCLKNKCNWDVQNIDVEEIITHEKYSGPVLFEHDIALIRLSSEVNTSWENARPVCLPTTESMINEPIIDEVATIAGWGSTKSSILMKANVKIREYDECLKYLRKHYQHASNLRICAGGDDKDACSGDSGGPLMIPRNNVYIQYGIISAGSKECGIGLPAFYTDIRKYMHWILDHMKP